MKLLTLNRKILHIAVPSIVSNVTVPFLGLVDTAITGHLGAASYLAAIAVGTSIFSVCYWVFSFLRMGTGGMTAQAFGAQDGENCRECLRKALTISTISGVAIICLQAFIANFSLSLMQSGPEVEGLARQYFKILVWGAPANLGLSALNGWFIGMQNAKAPMTIAIGQNVLNVVVSSLLVIVCGWKIEGVATGTLIAQWAGFLTALICVIRPWRQTRRMFAAEKTVEERIPSTSIVSWHRFFSVNVDIFFRTVCLVSVMFSFTSFGSRMGDNVLAVNAVLMQLFLLVSYFMDGFAYAAEALGGSLCGARDKEGFKALVHHIFVWGLMLSVMFSVFFIVGGHAFLAVLTDNAQVLSLADRYLPYIMVIPLISVGAFIYDGFFIGTTSTREMLVSIAIASGLYFAIVFTTSSNHGLWVAFLVYLGARGGVQHIMMRGIYKRFLVS